MANWDKTVDESGQQYIEINGKKFPCRTLKPHEMFADGEEGMRRFQEEMQRAREEFRRKEWESWLIVKDVLLR